MEKGFFRRSEVSLLNGRFACLVGVTHGVIVFCYAVCRYAKKEKDK
jgi:hypothetical protein